MPSSDKVHVHFAVTDEYRDEIRRDLDALDRASDLTPHLDVSALQPWPDPVVDTGETDVIECNRPEHQDGHHGPGCFPGAYDDAEQDEP